MQRIDHKFEMLLEYMKDKNYSFVCYAGDAGNDFCPIQKLTQNDLAFVRKGYVLEKKIPNMKESSYILQQFIIGLLAHHDIKSVWKRMSLYK